MKCYIGICKSSFACLFSVHDIRSSLVKKMKLRFERYLSYHDGRKISRNLASLNTLFHDVINLLYNDVGVGFCYLIVMFTILTNKKSNVVKFHGH